MCKKDNVDNEARSDYFVDRIKALETENAKLKDQINKFYDELTNFDKNNEVLIVTNGEIHDDLSNYIDNCFKAADLKRVS
jgi:predicted nuclease with TOPRIM domain